MRTKSPSERGQALILIALALIGMLALTALAVDGGNAYSERRRAQNAADAAALDAALAKVRGGDLYTEGLARADSNHYTDVDPSTGSSSSDVNVEIYNPPISGPYLDNDEYVQTIITATVKTYFGRVVGITEVTNKVEAVARAKPSIILPMFNGNAIVGLSPHDCKAIMYQGNAATTVTGGGIYTNSDCEDSAFFNNSGSAQLSTPCLQTVGGIQYKPGAINIDPPPTPPDTCINRGVPVLPPPAYPDPQCTHDAAIYNGNRLSAGNWPPAGHHGSTAFPPAGVTELDPGTYCLNEGDFDLTGNGATLNGNNVVIVVRTGNVSWGGGAEIHLSAPNTGPFKGLLLFMPETNHGTISINGNSNSEFTGSILAPSAGITINGTGGVNGFQGQIIGYTVKLSGTSGIKINYDPAGNYNAPVHPQIELVQ